MKKLIYTMVIATSLFISSQAFAIRACYDLIQEGDSVAKVKVLIMKCEDVELISEEYIGGGKWVLSIILEEKYLYPITTKGGVIIEIGKSETL